MFHKTSTLFAFGAILATTPALAGWEYFEQVSEEQCPGLYEVPRQDLIICRSVPGAAVAARAKVDRERRLRQLPAKVKAVDAVELGIVPDADTNLSYQYAHELLTADGKLAGYIDTHGYTNSEAEFRLKVSFRYTAQGKLASVSVVEF